MKTILNTLLLACALSPFTSFAQDPIVIDHLDNTTFTVDQYNPQPRTSLTIIGSGFFQGSNFNDVKNKVQLMLRQIYPRLGGYQVIPYGDQNGSRRPVNIMDIGPQAIVINMPDLLLPGNANTAWSLSVCAQGVGCSNSATIYLRGPGAPDVSIATGTNPIDLPANGKNQPIQLAVRGLTNNAPVLKIGKTTLQGNFDGSTTRFVIPASLVSAPNFVQAFVEDPMTGSDSEQFALRIFGVPNPQLPAPLSISQSLIAGQAIQDASFVIQMAQMTSPTKVEWIDGDRVTALNVPLDLLTSKAKITIPGPLLRVASYTGNLRLSNIAGEKLIPVNVTIGTIIIRPDPNPNPRPIPNPPRPRPIP